MVEVKFSDIGALEHAKRTLHELISLPLEQPHWFHRGILSHATSGVLLFGPPGTGKTMLAKAVAAQSGACFLSVNSSSIYDMYVGEGEKNARALFSLARRLSPCVLFIDEVDGLLDSREHGVGRASRIEVMNELMSEWDGLLSAKQARVMVMAATNRPFALDDAVLRRLPRRVLIDLPDAAARAAILRLLLKEDQLSMQVDLNAFAAQLEWYSGSDLKNLCIAAAYRALREIKSDQLIIDLHHLEGAREDVPASLSDRMDTVQQLRRWDQIYGEGRRRRGEDLGAGTLGF